MSAMTRCRAIIRTGIGFDTVDIEAARDLGIDVVNIPAYALDEVSDHALALLLTCVRKIPLLNEAVKGGVWDFKIAQPVPRLRGKTMGVVGLGRIGQMFVPKAAALGLDVIAYDPYHDPAATNSIPMVSFATLLRESDFVSIHVPLTEETEGMFDEVALRAMKPTAYLINTARGPIVRLDALYGALTKGWIAGAGLDVVETEPINPSHPILGCANLVVTPHFGWYSEGAMHELLQTVGQEAARVLRDERPLSVVNAEPQKSPRNTASA
jgi:D-3-phosphoglycerate dehydrogenase